MSDPLKAYVIGFEQTRDYEDDSKNAEMAKAMTPRFASKGK